ncbi:EAL domain-containing response regulator [Pseudoroseicyclus tamaricis]|uniref:EAL domain-containing protein n=1 Tax=Pseudoroseicyclus tamaricis TaxID=2705421 RepID=A0A6B2K038_9RHOB|nr:EAL domain-containing response regulator [Pseudoroseicyclus tamaricis]NDV01032.1 EAL domain-containing protein [Pseudoroseicyclus tamaricis]
MVVDAEPEARAALFSLSEQVGFEVVAAASGEAFLGLVELRPPDVAIIDLQMQDLDGLETMRELSHMAPRTRLIICSATSTKMLNIASGLARDYGLDVVASFPKPLPLEEMRVTLALLRRQQLTFGQEEIARALADGQIVPYLQPVVESGGGHPVMMEALTRWDHPRHGLLGPEAYLGALQDAGLGLALAEAMLDRGLAALAPCRRDRTGLRLALNLSVRDLAEPSVVDRLTAVCRRHGIAPDTVTLELTETATMDNRRAALERLTQLRLRGFGLAIDDFGRGYSSLMQLHDLPFSKIKIDKHFVATCDTRRDARAIITAIVALAGALELKTVAEGVERQEEWQTVAGLGCDEVQGYLLGRPMPGADAVAWLRQAAA